MAHQVPNQKARQSPAGQAEIAQWVAAMAAGDSDVALSRFYETFASPTMALIIRIVQVRAEAEELHQEIFVELWRRAGEYDPRRGSVGAWVSRIARSRAIDWMRARQRRGAGKHVVDVELPHGGASPESQMSQNRQRARVQHAMAALTDEQREALELSYFGGLSHGEIAARLGLPLGTVKSRILAAMKVLRRALTRPEGGLA